MHSLTFRLEEEHIQVLDRLAQTAGSRSQALRWLLEEAQKRMKEIEMESAYIAYFSDLATVKSEKELTAEMLQAASWTEEVK